ncbi:hypothetical protein [Haladaptatus sp. NG-SE-30]
MSHKDGGWRPDVGLETYAGFELWDHGIGPHEINDGEVDGDVSFDDDDLEVED